MHRLRRALLGAIALLAVAPAAAGASLHTVEPGSTGTGIDSESQQLAYHYAWDATGAPTGRLVLFLGGSTSKPGYYETFGEAAADTGMDVVDLRYVNPLVQQSCDGTSDACYTNVRGTTLFGEGSSYGRADATPWPSTTLSGGVHVDVADSAVNRLVALLEDLGWTQYLSYDTGSPYGSDPAVASTRAYPDWSKIVVAGHSQGAGHALFLAKRFGVVRAAMLSGPTDWVSGAPSWVTATSATAASKLYGLAAGATVAGDEEGAYCDHCATDWAAAGVPSTHVVATDLLPHSCVLKILCGALNWHDSTAVDSAVHRDGLLASSPATLAPTWQAMLTGTL